MYPRGPVSNSILTLLLTKGYCTAVEHIVDASGQSARGDKFSSHSTGADMGMHQRIVLGEGAAYQKVGKALMGVNREDIDDKLAYNQSDDMPSANRRLIRSERKHNIDRDVDTPLGLTEQDTQDDNSPNVAQEIDEAINKSATLERFRDIPERPESALHGDKESEIKTKEHTSAKCMDHEMTGDRKLYMHPCHHGNNQKFYWDENWRIHSSHYGEEYCFDAEHSGAHLKLMPCNTKSNQKFNFGLRRRIWYSLKNRGDGMENDCVERSTEDNRLYLHPCNHENEHQQFYFTHRRRRRNANLGSADLGR